MIRAAVLVREIDVRNPELVNAVVWYVDRQIRLRRVERQTRVSPGLPEVQVCCEFLTIGIVTITLFLFAFDTLS